VGRPLGATGLIPFRESDLLCAQALLAVYRGPGYGSVAATQEFLVDSFMATAAIARGQFRRKNKSVMFLSSLICGRPVAIETREAAARMGAQFKLMHDGVLQLSVAFRAFARSTRESITLFAGIRYGPVAVDQECAHDQRESDHQRDEHGPKWHDSSSHALQT